MRDLGRAVPAHVNMGAGAVAFGVTPNGWLVNRSRDPIKFERAVIADSVGSEVGVPDWVAILCILRHRGDDSPSDERISIRKDLHATLAGRGKRGSGAEILVEYGGSLGRCVHGDNHTR